ncbi:bifunctional diguanylate cyclase/phosphohydrolase [Desulfotomaculum sp. 1211_IL3151]|uniref:bifunctional diguanylate cyclase/phosphohydrolase n=1 Tax=Desulfotomaculum sp. 1211_IL3151 TaxID=3084055 RepID=UPI002FD8E180
MQIYREILDQVFQKEIALLQSGKEEMNNPLYIGNELLPKYQELLKEYEKLLKVSRKVFLISDSQGKILKRREYEIKNLLDNTNQGFLTFGQDLLVDTEYSVECKRIFGKKVANANIIDLLCIDNPDSKERMEKVLEMVFHANSLNTRKQYLLQLPSIIDINQKSIEVAYKYIEETESAGKQVLVILTDITEKLESKAQIEFLSNYDSLTGLFNRAYIDKIIFEIVRPANLPLSVIVGDMNGLKLINDTFGHAKGDQLIINAARVLQECCRELGIVARWGGDEFLILLPNTNQEICQKIEDKIAKACQETPPNPIELSIAMGNATLEDPETTFSEVFNNAENKMYKKKLVESKAIRQKIIADVQKRLQTSSFTNEGHINRIQKVAIQFAKFLGCSVTSTEVRNLKLLAALHDVGNLAIPQDILCKPGKLTDEEWEIVKRHSEIGYRMGLSVGESTVAEAILAMHERWDGSGYPSGLKGEQIPFISRLLAIIDTYDVMTHDRIFRKAFTREEALEEIRLQSGKQFDPTLVKAFLEQADILFPYVSNVFFSFLVLRVFRNITNPRISPVINNR